MISSQVFAQLHVPLTIALNKKFLLWKVVLSYVYKLYEQLYILLDRTTIQTMYYQIMICQLSGSLWKQCVHICITYFFTVPPICKARCLPIREDLILRKTYYVWSNMDHLKLFFFFKCPNVFQIFVQAGTRIYSVNGLIQLITREHNTWKIYKRNNEENVKTINLLSITTR